MSGMMKTAQGTFVVPTLEIYEGKTVEVWAISKQGKRTIYELLVLDGKLHLTDLTNAK